MLTEKSKQRDVYVFEQRENGRKFSEIAKELHVTPERVRQIFTRVERRKKHERYT